MALSGRQVTYYSLRAGALTAFLASAFMMPRGAAAGGVCLAAGVVAALSGLGVNAGGPGERAGARTTSDYFASVSAPQGDWPPFDESRVVEGELDRRDTAR